MKKVLSILLVVLLLFGVTAAVAEVSKIEPQKVKLAHIAGETSALNRALLKFADLVKERTDGQLEIEVFAAGILGGETELKEMVSMGTVQMVSTGWSLLTNKLSYSIAYFGYYQMLDRDELNAFYSGEIAKKFYDAYEKATGVRVINHNFYQAPRNVMAVKPIEKLEDLKGLVMRTPNGVSVDLEAWASWGCQPVGMAISECFTAFEQGVIQAVEMPSSYMSSYSFAEAGAKYIMKSEHQIYNNLMGVNAQWFDALPADIQQIIIDSANEAGDYCKELESADDQAYIDDMVAKQGVTVIEWTPEFKAQLKELVTPVYLENQKKALEEADALLN
ncbi:MAG: TRAP transporter substrate-binding protein [Clostridiales bacterium]|nr:TRAP transporter substrate-binding protein [Clostridiales bacterium]